VAKWRSLHALLCPIYYYIIIMHFYCIWLVCIYVVPITLKVMQMYSLAVYIQSHHVCSYICACVHDQNWCIFQKLKCMYIGNIYVALCVHTFHTVCISHFQNISVDKIPYISPNLHYYSAIYNIQTDHMSCYLIFSLKTTVKFRTALCSSYVYSTIAI